MNRTAQSRRAIGLAVTTALAGALLAGCATTGAPRADLSAAQAQTALAKGDHRGAITHAEAAVAADPRNAAFRATLGSVYLDAGRFSAAATSFDDAMLLGDRSARTALSLALALSGEGKHREAAALLNNWEGDIAIEDLGLALALAGQPDRGVHLMSDAIRAGQNDAKIRQNLAYAYALAGRWREARLMAAQDLPGDQLGARMEQWAMMAHPQAWQLRVADLLQVPAGVNDPGQPTQLALSNTPATEQLAAEAASQAAPAALADTGELTPLQFTTVAEAAPIAPPVAAAAAETKTGIHRIEEARSTHFSSAFAAPAPAPALAHPSPAWQEAATRMDAAPPPATAQRPAQKRAPEPVQGTHLVQLGSFASEQSARRAWKVYTQRYPELSDHQLVISEAVVRGKRYWRVSAGGYPKASAEAMCGKVRSSGKGCFAYAEGRPLPGAVESGIRMARR